MNALLQFLEHHDPTKSPRPTKDSLLRSSTFNQFSPSKDTKYVEYANKT